MRLLVEIHNSHLMAKLKLRIVDPFKILPVILVQIKMFPVYQTMTTSLVMDKKYYFLKSISVKYCLNYLSKSTQSWHENIQNDNKFKFHKNNNM